LFSKPLWNQGWLADANLEALIMFSSKFSFLKLIFEEKPFQFWQEI